MKVLTSKKSSSTKTRWAQTKSYREYEQRNIPKAKYGQYTEEMMSIFADFSVLRHLEPDSKAVQTKAAELQSLYHRELLHLLRRNSEKFRADVYAGRAAPAEH